MDSLGTPEDEGSAAGRLSPGWWVRALARHERGGAPEADGRQAADGPAGWLADPPAGGDARTAQPAWVPRVEQAVAAAAALSMLPPMDSWPQAFAIPLRPFLVAARDRVAEAAECYLPPGHGHPGPIADTFTAALGRQLARIAVRTMAAELDEERTSNRLAGGDEWQRFADFIRQQSTSARLASLFGAYPVLARLLGAASQRAAEAGLELLARFGADRAAVVKTLLGGVDPGPVVAVRPGLGDLHRQGRSVAAVSFADGRTVIYKPRGIQAHVRFSEMIGWLNERVPLAGLRAAAAVARPGYGWLEFIAGGALARPGEAEEFYRREGVLLAALHAMHAVDIHCENLIACGDQPVLIDVETLFHPTLPAAHAAADDPAAEALAASVQRTALLPYVMVGEQGILDRSGMGGDQGEICPEEMLDWDPPASDQMQLIRRAVPFTGAGNRPVFKGEMIEPAGYEAAVLAGFRLGYDAIVADRKAFTQFLESCGDAEVRIVVRPSSGYWRLLDESTHPGLLRDARDRDGALDVLQQVSADQPLWRELVPAELADLWDGDIPLMTGRPASRDIWTAAGQRRPDLLDRTGLSCALEKVAAMGEVDRRDQEWVISASLATRRPAGGHRSTEPMPGPLTATAADAGPLLAAACGLADQIVARGMTSREGTGPGRVNWLGLQLVEDTRWMVLPMGADLADGYLGVALFLAQLADLTGIARYAEVARCAVSSVPQLCGILAGRSDLLTAVGCGGTEGLGGISYGLARMATLLQDSELREWAETAVDLAATAADRPAPPGWAAGRAGCLAAMTAVQAELGSAAAAGVARVSADRLTELVEQTGGRCGPDGDPVPPGFAAGPAGIGWALTRFAAAGAGPGYAAAGSRAMRSAGEPVTAAPEDGPHGWCCGTAGLLLARTCRADDITGPALQAAVAVLDGRPVLRDLSLCHGELGMTEALTVLETLDRSGVSARSRRHRAGLILDAINRHAPYCGTPGGVSTPGLLRGLAGIGYGLLRLGFAERVPSVLLLEPTPRPAQPHRPA